MVCKVILVFCFGPELRLKWKSRTKLNKNFILTCNSISDYIPIVKYSKVVLVCMKYLFLDCLTDIRIGI